MNAREVMVRDHFRLTERQQSEVYFKTLARALSRLSGVVNDLRVRQDLSSVEAVTIDQAIGRLVRNFEAMRFKHFGAQGRSHPGVPEGVVIDIEESGFPIYQEIFELAADASNAKTALVSFPDREKLMSGMLNEILTKAREPLRLQDLMAKRLMMEKLDGADLFLVRSEPEIQAEETSGDRRRWTMSWSVYDSQLNLPMIYVMSLDDTNRQPLVEDKLLLASLSAHLSAQSISSLTLNTIAEGVDADFKRLHPTSLKRFVIGPFYAQGLTDQSENVQRALDKAGVGTWIMAMTKESVFSQETQKSGFFGQTEMQSYGKMEAEQVVLAPQTVQQAILDHLKAEFATATKYTTDTSGRTFRN